MTNKASVDILATIEGAFQLQLLPKRVNLAQLARKWGVTSIEVAPIKSDAMLLPGKRGHKIILREATTRSSVLRQRFSMAHELGHLLLEMSGFPKQSNFAPSHRGSYHRNSEELLCDKIAAEILMPRLAFLADGEKHGWSLEGLTTLSKEYDTSIPATAIRMIDLMPETSVLAVWKPPTADYDVPALQWTYSCNADYDVPKKTPRQRLWLIPRASNSEGVQEGPAPIRHGSRKTRYPLDVPAESLAWGRGEYRQVMVFYYPERELSDDMKALARATSGLR